MPPLLRYTLKNLIRYAWQFIFKLLILPFYKLFLFINKKINQYLLHNPYLTEQQFKKTLQHNSPAHLLILFITLFVLFSNLHTRETYAEELNKNSIFAQLFANQDQEEIIEVSPDINGLKTLSQTQNETILNQLMALKPSVKNSSSLPQSTQQKTPSTLAVSPSNNALIDINSNPFKNISATNNVTTENNKPPLPKNKKNIITYTVRTGDTLSSLAKKFNISINTILWENNLSLKSYLQPGDKLTILPINGISYKVRRGDTLSSIAKKFNSSLNKIISYNSLSTNSLIKAGQKLIIPDAKLFTTTPRPTKTIYARQNNSSRLPSRAVSSGHTFIWPTNSKRITQYYHWRHHAIDIGNHIGQPIYAPISGRVIKAGWSTGYGYNVVIDNGHGVRTRTAHASKLYVKRGQMVKQGEVVAAVGSTGWSTGPHVHFEIMINGVKVNPLNYL